MCFYKSPLVSAIWKVGGMLGYYCLEASWFTLTWLSRRITPHEWDNPHPCKSDPDQLETLFELRNSLWFGISSLFCQGSDILPKYVNVDQVNGSGLFLFLHLFLLSFASRYRTTKD